MTTTEVAANADGDQETPRHNRLQKSTGMMEESSARQDRDQWSVVQPPVRQARPPPA